MKLNRKDFILIDGVVTTPELPEGCMGVILVFESKKTARAFDKDAPLTPIERPGQK